MKLTTRQIAYGIYQSIDQTKPVDTKKIYRYLKKKKITKKISVILRSLKNIYIENSRTSLATVVSHIELSHLEKELIENFLKKTITGKPIEFIYQVDNQLLAGAQIKVNDYLFDFSLKSRLQKIKNQF
ncbi:MAG: F0F1 ATP synthase subunit delta [Patescibacteria group bacterium]